MEKLWKANRCTNPFIIVLCDSCINYNEKKKTDKGLDFQAGSMFVSN